MTTVSKHYNNYQVENLENELNEYFSYNQHLHINLLAAKYLNLYNLGKQNSLHIYYMLRDMCKTYFPYLTVSHRKEGVLNMIIIGSEIKHFYNDFIEITGNGIKNIDSFLVDKIRMMLLNNSNNVLISCSVINNKLVFHFRCLKSSAHLYPMDIPTLEVKIEDFRQRIENNTRIFNSTNEYCQYLLSKHFQIVRCIFDDLTIADEFTLTFSIYGTEPEKILLYNKIRCIFATFITDYDITLTHYGDIIFTKLPIIRI